MINEPSDVCVVVDTITQIVHHVRKGALWSLSCQSVINKAHFREKPVRTHPVTCLPCLAASFARFPP